MLKCRLEYGKKMPEFVQNNQYFRNRVIVSAEAHFSLNGAINKQNCWFSDPENVGIAHQEPLQYTENTVGSIVCYTHHKTNLS